LRRSHEIWVEPRISRTRIFQVRYSLGHKAGTRKKIVTAACRCLKERGIKGTGVCELMKLAGLTHGGFYMHFASKDALVIEAIVHSLEESRQSFDRWGRMAPEDKQPLHAIIDNYLSFGHRENVPMGCPMPTLGADVARSGAATKAAATAKLEEIIRVLGRYVAGGTQREREKIAIGLLAGIVGAMLLARATDRALSDQFLAVTAQFLKDAIVRGDMPRRLGTQVREN